MGVLIVEDSAFQARILSELLKPIGTAVFIAPTVKEAFEVLQTVQISLVISDLYMPRKEDGMRFIRRVKSSSEMSDTELFVCTVDDSMETRASLKALGVQHIFVKPYNGSDLLRAVRGIFWYDPEQGKEEYSSAHMPPEEPEAEEGTQE